MSDKKAKANKEKSLTGLFVGTMIRRAAKGVASTIEGAAEGFAEVIENGEVGDKVDEAKVRAKEFGRTVAKKFQEQSDTVSGTVNDRASKVLDSIGDLQDSFVAFKFREEVKGKEASKRELPEELTKLVRHYKALKAHLCTLAHEIEAAPHNSEVRSHLIQLHRTNLEAMDVVRNKVLDDFSPEEALAFGLEIDDINLMAKLVHHRYPEGLASADVKYDPAIFDRLGKVTVHEPGFVQAQLRPDDSKATYYGSEFSDEDTKIDAGKFVVFSITKNSEII